MKIYFGFTVAGDRSGLVAARKIVDVLQGMGHEVLTAHLLGEDAWEADRRVSPSDVYRRDMNWLSGCDIFLAEVSGSSFGLGFETGYLLGATKKRVVLFYQRNVEQKNISFDYRHHTSQLQASSVFEDRGTGRTGSKQPIGLIDVKVQSPQILRACDVESFERCRRDTWVQPRSQGS